MYCRGFNSYPSATWEASARTTKPHSFENSCQHVNNVSGGKILLIFSHVTPLLMVFSPFYSLRNPSIQLACIAFILIPRFLSTERNTVLLLTYYSMPASCKSLREDMNQSFSYHCVSNGIQTFENNHTVETNPTSGNASTNFPAIQ